MMPLEIETIRDWHAEKEGSCGFCSSKHVYQPWPCDAAKLVIELAAKDAQIAALVEKFKLGFCSLAKFDTCGDPFCTEAREILGDLSAAASRYTEGVRRAERERLRGIAAQISRRLPPSVEDGISASPVRPLTLRRYQMATPKTAADATPEEWARYDALCKTTGLDFPTMDQYLAVEAEAGRLAVEAERATLLLLFTRKGCKAVGAYLLGSDSQRAALLAPQEPEVTPKGVVVTVIHRCRRCIPSTVYPSEWDLNRHVDRFHPGATEAPTQEERT